MLKVYTFIALLTLGFQSIGQTGPTVESNFGSNVKIGKHIAVNGIKIYYETYGSPSNPPLLLIHGNDGSIKDLGSQITHFMADYHVIVADNRSHGRTENGDQELTFELLAKDYNELLAALKIDSAYVIGDSDGGIVGLLLAMRYPDRVKKLVSVSPNLRPDSTAVYQWDIIHLKEYLVYLDSTIASSKPSKEILRTQMHMTLLDKYPNIALDSLKKIQAPVLLVSSDADVIRLEHIVEIYQNLPRAHLFIMPGTTHLMIHEKPDLFNREADKFFTQPFTRPTTRQLFYGE